MRTSRTLSALLVLPLLLLSIVPATAQEDAELVDRVIAVVNDQIILESEVHQYVQDIVLRNRSEYQDPEKVNELREQVLQELINQKILLAIAEEDTNVVVEDRMVDQTLDQRLNQVSRELGGESKLEEYYGKPVRQIRRDFRKQVYESMLVDRLRQMKMSNVTVTRQEVKAYYEANADELPLVPARVKLGHILINVEPTEEAQTVAKALADSIFSELMMGADFNALAMEYSDDPGSRARGGLLGTTQRGDLVPEYERVAFGLDEGEISEPVRSRFGYHIIRLNWRRGEKINTSHILINLRPSDADLQRALEKARDIYREIQAGAPFDSLAREFSHDSETAALGGDLGWFDIPRMSEQYRIVVEDLAEGEVSQPFRSEDGIQMLKLLERKEPRPVDLQKDWERISELALQQKQERVYSRWIEEKRSEVYIEVKI